MKNVYDANAATSAEEASKIIPRAEYRVFGQGVLDIVKKSMWKAQAKLFKVRESRETYFLSTATNEANVKVRDGLLDIKTKVGETENGYEIFQPRGKFQFPVGKQEVATILENMKAEVNLVKEEYTLDDFIAIVEEHPGLAAVSVFKKRFGFSVNDIICEYGIIEFNGAVLETACCESEDYEGMTKAIEALEIGHLENRNYLKAAKSVIGMV
ncbi:hypothetical protein [Desulfovibrio sp. Huiquan2017]|uniref:hypothetical protein n=1 Tax=Desulfovibrio sp. Huiquan2017 TaxID=2816861 RepID=UPI001A927D38|nr:hypothetical protein [Desulfovibrio sp. Huiquan2017]